MPKEEPVKFRKSKTKRDAFFVSVRFWEEERPALEELERRVAAKSRSDLINIALEFLAKNWPRKVLPQKDMEV